MYNFVAVLVSPPMQIGLGFKTYASARAAREKAKERVKENGNVTITDDFGREFETDGKNISAFLIEDNQASQEMQGEKQIDMARANETFVKRRSSDVELIRLFPGNNIARGGLQ